MDNKEREFAQIVLENKRRIYTVCYMFSKDADEVNDLFQEILVNIILARKINCFYICV